MTGEQSIELNNLNSLLESLEPLSKNESIQSSILANSVRSFTVFLQGTIKQNLKLKQVLSDLTLFEFDSERTKLIELIWKKYYISLSKHISTKNLSISPLVDLDWRFGVTASSSEVAQVGATFLQLKLTIKDSKNENKNIYLELTLKQFFDFLHQMEKAKSTIDYFS